MAKFRRPLEVMLPKCKAWRAEEMAKRRAEGANSELQDFDLY